MLTNAIALAVAVAVAASESVQLAPPCVQPSVPTGYEAVTAMVSLSSARGAGETAASVTRLGERVVGWVIVANVLPEALEAV